MQEWQQFAQQESRSSNWSLVWILIGIFLAPAGIGIIILIVVWMQYSDHNNKRQKAEHNQTVIRKNIVGLRQVITEVKAELVNLG